MSLRANAIIAGVHKAGTSSLFVSLAAHPDVAPAAVKETRYFLPARYGEPLPPVADYERQFERAGDRPVRLEATPAYLYGGAALARAVRAVCGTPRVVVVLREPVSRLVSYFTFQKARLRLDPTVTLAEYVARAERMRPEDFRQLSDDVWFGLEGGRYATYLAPWVDELGHDLRVVFFDDLLTRGDRVLTDLAVWLGIDPARFPSTELASENRTTGFRNRTLQRVALTVNDRLEPWLRRHHGIERRVRALYYRCNGRPAGVAVPGDLLVALGARYAEANRELAALLRASGVVGSGLFPSWLSSAPPSSA